MTTTVTSHSSASRTDASSPAPRRRSRGRIADRILFAYTWLIIVWLSVPVLVMILFGFNNPKGRYNQALQFPLTFKWYGKLFEIPALTEALVNSLVIGVSAMLISGTLGTLVGIALGRYRFRGHSATNLVMFAVISSPELVMGASLLSFFVTAGLGLGLITILISHVMFSISFVAVVVRSRVLTLDPNIEEAARDLGAGPWTTFRLVTLPMIFPAVLSGGLLAFVLSIDDFVITNFTSGTTTTFPLWIWGATRVGLPPQVNVMGTLIFAVGLLIVVANAVLARRRAR
jgi:spermidine/putrescine transport system permease protein